MPRLSSTSLFYVAEGQQSLTQPRGCWLPTPGGQQSCFHSGSSWVLPVISVVGKGNHGPHEGQFNTDGGPLHMKEGWTCTYTQIWDQILFSSLSLKYMCLLFNRILLSYHYMYFLITLTHFVEEGVYVCHATCVEGKGQSDVACVLPLPCRFQGLKPACQVRQQMLIANEPSC